MLSLSGTFSVYTGIALELVVSSRKRTKSWIEIVLRDLGCVAGHFRSSNFATVAKQRRTFRSVYWLDGFVPAPVLQ